MGNCKMFHSSLTLNMADDYKTVESYFMENVVNFTGPLNINDNFVNAMKAGTPSYTRTQSLSTSNNTDKCYTQGITINGEGKYGLQNLLLNRTSSPYRKLIVA